MLSVLLTFAFVTVLCANRCTLRMMRMLRWHNALCNAIAPTVWIVWRGVYVCVVVSWSKQIVHFFWNNVVDKCSLKKCLCQFSPKCCNHLQRPFTCFNVRFTLMFMSISQLQTIEVDFSARLWKSSKLSYSLRKIYLVNYSKFCLEKILENLWKTSNTAHLNKNK